jgi:hypothetical protein
MKAARKYAGEIVLKIRQNDAEIHFSIKITMAYVEEEMEIPSHLLWDQNH